MVPVRQASIVLLSLICALGLLIFSSTARGELAENVIDESPDGAEYAAGELVVTYKEKAPDVVVESLDEETGAKVEESMEDIDAKVLEFPEVVDESLQSVRERDLERKKTALERDPAVESVDYNYVYRGFYTPNDPKFGRQYGLRKPGFEKAWSRARGNRTRVAIVDSGAAVKHVDLYRKVVLAYDFRNDNRTVEDLHGHGTHVAGIVAANTGNRKGVAGSCPGCKLIIAKALDKNLAGYNSDISKAIIWSANHGAKVINLSLGSTSPSSTLRNAVAYATKKGALVVAAGGNYGTSEKVYPAAYGNAVAVAYTDRYDRRASNSSYGNYIDVAAPGVDILSTVPGGYAYKSGSSMASPEVAGLAGILAGQGIGPKGIRRRIQRTALDLGPKGGDPYYGAGRIRANRAVR